MGQILPTHAAGTRLRVWSVRHPRSCDLGAEAAGSSRAPSVPHLPGLHPGPRGSHRSVGLATPGPSERGSRLRGWSLRSLSGPLGSQASPWGGVRQQPRSRGGLIRGQASTGKIYPTQAVGRNHKQDQLSTDLHGSKMTHPQTTRCAASLLSGAPPS